MTLFSRLLSFLGLRRLPDAPPPSSTVVPRCFRCDRAFPGRAPHGGEPCDVPLSTQTKPVAYEPVYAGRALSEQQIQDGVLVPLLSVRKQTGPAPQRGPKPGCGPECLGCFHCAVTKN